jgi:hypothetical protein
MITIDFNSFWKEDNLLKEETIEFVKTNIGEPDKITLWKEIKEDLDSNYSIFFNYKDFHLHGILAIGNPLNRLSITGEDTEYLTRNKVSKVLNVTVQTWNNWRREGVLNPLKIGGRVLYRKEDVYNNSRLVA